MPNQNLKIFLAIFLSIFVFFGGKYLIENYQNIRTGNIKIQLSFGFLKSNQQSSNFASQNNSFSLSSIIQPLISPSPLLAPTRLPTKIWPTAKPRVTSAPQPTAEPETFPIDPSLAREGQTIDEVFQIAADKTCVPKEVLRAIAMIESGGFFDTVPLKWFLLYNSENWWNSEFLTDVDRACSGHDYNFNDGKIPSDSLFAGYQCRDAQKAGDFVGVMGLSAYNASGKVANRAAGLIGVDKVDRRIIMDSLVLAGLLIRSNVKTESCTDWSGHDVVLAACGYYGSCGIANGVNYCATFCRNYSSLGGSADCGGADNIGQDNCWK